MSDTACATKPEPTAPANPSAVDAVKGEVNVSLVMRVLVLSTFVVILNETIMVNAIPRLMRELRCHARAAQWLSTAFMLTMAVVIPVTGWFLQRVTTRTAYALAMGAVPRRHGARGGGARPSRCCSSAASSRPAAPR